ncbi:1-aminocyclopropane-1-carboxylate deaminase [Macroventuria anomochaeta]|uniref:1-aminocyclopropane-1-carboxylate deaminase n=1 Tax=Macroventuria anomochaeta TaxID=301207 RepID=A0ACB6RU33_9PLEO|nr:1-aminocyclopropane-1-carboxylate deaminase [Macroventuria anomochaeta]KAF2624459.1 1-aminocyclopropane-1-carboxylate deaminase [Macroventuria anomochaeta]
MATFTVRLPRPFADIPRAALMYPHATTIEPLKNLTAHLKSESNAPRSIPNLWIKHEDTNSALAYGGNKVRKLEYVLADAIAKKATHLVTVGGVQSNSQRQVAAAGNRFRMKTVLTPDPKIGNPSAQDRGAYESAGNVQINGVLGAEWKPSTPEDRKKANAEGGDGLAYEVAARREMEKIRAEGGTPYFIPSGASLHSLGGLGFARWAYELVEQEKELGVEFDAIVVSTASGSTLGGMVTGFKLLSEVTVRRRLIGIQATSCDLIETSRVVKTSAENTAELVGLQKDSITEDDFELEGRFNGGAYSHLNEKTKDAIKLLANTEGILTDPVYTGKAVAGLLGLAREGAFGEAKNVLFVHTGGTPALSAYPSFY